MALKYKNTNLEVNGNLKVTSNLTDGTNSISVAEIVNKQDALTAGSGISLENDTVSVDTNVIATKTSVDNISSVIPPSASSVNQLLTIDEGQSLLRPEFIGSVTTASINIPGVSNYNGAEFNLGVNSTELNGLYVFTFGNAMNLIPIYGITSNTQYKISGMINNGDDSFSNVVLSYNYTGQKLQFYCVRNLIPIGYTAYLYKIKLY